MEIQKRKKYIYARKDRVVKFEKGQKYNEKGVGKL